MIEFMYLFLPGAITFLIAEKCSRKPTERSFIAFMEWILYSGIDIGIFWLLRKRQEISVVTVTEDGHLKWEFAGNPFWMLLIIAVISGILLSIVREIDMEFKIVPRNFGLFSKLSVRVQKMIKRTVLAACVLAVIGVVISPTVSTYLEKKSRRQFQKTSRELLVKIQNEVNDQLKAGVAWEDLGDFVFGDITVKRVENDQKWNAASKNGTKDGVYLVDKNGAVVYIAYRDAAYCGSWSGPTEDAEFLESHGSWNGGLGYGWSGFGMRQD